MPPRQVRQVPVQGQLPPPRPPWGAWAGQGVHTLECTPRTSSHTSDHDSRAKGNRSQMNWAHSHTASFRHWVGQAGAKDTWAQPQGADRQGQRLTACHTALAQGAEDIRPRTHPGPRLSGPCLGPAKGISCFYIWERIPSPTGNGSSRGREGVCCGDMVTKASPTPSCTAT